jgi:hypothetical protein
MVLLVEGTTYIYRPIDNFVDFYLSYCDELKEFPTFISQLTSLQELTMWQCSKLKKLPTSIGQLMAL